MELIREAEGAGVGFESLHEKAGMSQVGFSSFLSEFVSLRPSRLCRQPSTHTLFLSDDRSVLLERSRFGRRCNLIILLFTHFM